MKLLRLPRSKVRLGEPLPWNIRDEGARLLLSRGHIVESEEQLEALLSRGAFVDIEEARAVAHQEELAEKERLSLSALQRPENLFSLWDHSAAEMEKLMARLPDHPPSLEQITGFADRLIDLVDQDVDMALYHMVRQESAHLYYYGYNHAIHASVLCLLMARRLQWAQPRILSLVRAALTMNMPILQLQGTMAEQAEPMRDSQRTQIHAHPELAVQWLVKAGVTDPDWLTAIAQHHEHSDGKGYPHGLTTPTELAVALRVADVFMAKISPRKLRSALPIQEAARELFREDHGGPLSSAVIKEFGLYPPGELVKLSSGEIAVVMRRTDSVKCPLVASITDERGHPTVHTVQRDTSQAPYAIVGPVADKTLVARMPPERIYGYQRLSSATATDTGPASGHST
ncbi:MAG: phosphohydrolase [Burkholderiaceae bacterium]|jgi:HD-GYP domain-containing protein (c-di-GMP phosphodiesterase class II)|nr:phosphohydrolase [Burkholderiaceae bacterium]